MTRTLNISLDVPSKRRHSQAFLQGLSMPEGKSDKDLIDEYLSEKYV